MGLLRNKATEAGPCIKKGCEWPLGDKQSRPTPTARLLLDDDLDVAPEQHEESDEAIE